MSSPSWARNMTQGFGPTDEALDGPYAGYEHFNKGHDYGLPLGTPVEANVGGTVIAVSNDPNNSTGWGKYVWVRDEKGFIHRYGHLSETSIREGSYVQPGTLLGKVGSTGKSTGPHLSYDVSDQGGNFIDPARFLGGGDMGDTPAGWGASEWGEYDFLRKTLPALQKSLDSLWQLYQKGDTSVDYEEMLTLMANVQAGYVRMAELETGGTDDDRAQKAFQNALDLGDYQGRQADRAYQRWSDKKSLAETMAEIAAAEPGVKNKANADLADRMTDRYNYGQGPQPSTKTFLPVSYDDALKKYEQQLGIGPEPSSSLSDYGGPALPSGSSGAGGRVIPPLPPEEPGGTTDTRTRWQQMVDQMQSLQQKSKPNPFDALKEGYGRTSGGSKGVGGSIVDALSKTRKLWQQTMEMPFRRYATGTMSAQPGPAMVGENGPETIIRPDGSSMVIGGPSQMTLEGGEMIAPSDVPPDQAMSIWQIKQAAAADQQNMGRGNIMAEASMRAQDPDLQQKVMALIMDAVAANMAANPPKTPQLKGPWSEDPWADLRPLSGVPATNVPPEAAAAGGGPPR